MRPFSGGSAYKPLSLLQSPQLSSILGSISKNLFIYRPNLRFDSLVQARVG